MKLVLQKKDSGLVPANASSQKKLGKFSEGERMGVTIEVMRSEQQLKMWWALCEIISKVLEGRYPRKSVSDYLLLKVGHSERIEYPDGSHVLSPKSVSFSTSQEVMNQIVDSVLPIVTEEFYPAADGELREELKHILWPDLLEVERQQSYLSAG